MNNDTPRPTESASPTRSTVRSIGRMRETTKQADGSEVTREFWERDASRPPHPLREFTMVGASGAIEIARDLGKALHQRDFRVLFYALGACSFGNVLEFTQQDVAEALEMDRGDVSRSFKRLQTAGLLILDPSTKRLVGKPKRWSLSPFYFGKGSGKVLEAAREQMTDEHRRTVRAAGRRSVTPSAA